jgi:hypothetical protein
MVWFIPFMGGKGDGHDLEGIIAALRAEDGAWPSTTESQVEKICVSDPDPAF